MAIAHSTWRSHPFEIGQTYVAAQSFVGFSNSNFIKGVSYKLCHVAYSHYDSATVFTFQAPSSNDSFNWWWYDEEQDSLCSERFHVTT
jgi:hypothetical protein